MSAGNEDWRAGDMALCVTLGLDRRWVPEALRVGGIYTVTEVFLARAASGRTVTGLVLAEVRPAAPHPAGFAAWAFRKIHPHAPDAEDAETIALLRGGKVDAEAGA